MEAWRDAGSLLVDPSDTSEIERVSKKYLRKGIRLAASNLRFLDPESCFYAARDDGSNTVFLIPEDDSRDFGEHLLVSKIDGHYGTQNQGHEAKKSRRH